MSNFITAGAFSIAVRVQAESMDWIQQGSFGICNTIFRSLSFDQGEELLSWGKYGLAGLVKFGAFAISQNSSNSFKVMMNLIGAPLLQSCIYYQFNESIKNNILKTPDHPLFTYLIEDFNHSTQNSIEIAHQAGTYIENQMTRCTALDMASAWATLPGEVLNMCTQMNLDYGIEADAYIGLVQSFSKLGINFLTEGIADFIISCKM